MKPAWEIRMEQKLKKKFYTSFFAILGFALFAVVVCLPLAILSEDSIYFILPLAILSEDSIYFILPMLILVVPAIICFFPIFKDFSSVRSGTFEKMTGEVIRYKREGASTDTYDYKTVIRDDKTGEEMELNGRIKDTDIGTLLQAPTSGIGERYVVLYLKNSKVAVFQRIAPSYDD